MRGKQFVLLAVVILSAFLALKISDFTAMEDVKKGEAEGSYPDEWYEMIAEEVNGKGIRIVVDGQEKKVKKKAVMAENGSFLIPVSELTGLFSCSAHIYDQNLLVMEKNTVRAEIKEGSESMTVTETASADQQEKMVSLPCALAQKDENLYVPVQAVAEAFSYDMDWEPDTNILSFSSLNPELDRLPKAYDYRTVGRAPTVKNQGSLGTCWAFASLMALESRLLPEEAYDFSEDHMSIRNSFRMNQNDGGEYTMSMAYLLAWQGPVLEKDDPYGDNWSPADLAPVRHVQEIQILPEKDYEAIKKAIYFTGGVQSSLYTSMADGAESSEYYNKEEGAYCYTGNRKPNHDVVIIGWDDSYPKENFPAAPEGDGAFICANSWGGAFGDEGYFYVSYYDSNIGVHNILYSRADSPDNYDHIYQSDLCGWVGQLGYGKAEAYFANVYEAGDDETLCAAGFYATDQNTQYEVYVVNDVSGSADFSRRRSVARGTLKNAGFYTIDFERPVELKKGEKYGVIVSIRTPGSVHPVAIEYNAPDKAARVDLSDGEGYISLRGTAWDRVETEQNCNICLKAYTKDREEN